MDVKPVCKRVSLLSELSIIGLLYTQDDIGKICVRLRQVEYSKLFEEFQPVQQDRSCRLFFINSEHMIRDVESSFKDFQSIFSFVTVRKLVDAEKIFASIEIK